MCLCCWISGAVLFWFMSMWWWPWSRKALKCVVNFKYVGRPVGVNSTRALKAVCILCHFAGSGVFYNFHCLLEHLEITSTSAEDEKGTWWTDRGWKRVGEKIKGSEKTKWGKELGNQKRAPGDNGKYLIVEWQGEQQLHDCYLRAAGCLAFQALGVGIAVTWKHLWCVLPQDPAPYRNGNSYWWRRFLCSPSPFSVMTATTREHVPPDLLHTRTGCCPSQFLSEHSEEYFPRNMSSERDSRMLHKGT